MVFINEWFPNPNGADAKGEFIELYNNGGVSVNLNGWILKTTAKKNFSLGGYNIPANGYLVLKKAQTKLSLKNTGDTVFLYDAAGHLADQSIYLGAAPSGQSFSRVYYPTDDNDDAAPQSFAWGSPTPGAANKVNLHNGISVNAYPFNVPLNRAEVGGVEMLGAFLLASAILAALVVYFLKRDENMQKLFFPRDEGVWGRLG
jgi:hypothetical protein